MNAKSAGDRVSHLKVLMLCPGYLPGKVGGTEVFVQSLSRELCKQRWRVHAAVHGQNEAGESYELDGIPVHVLPKVRPLRRRPPFPTEPMVRALLLQRLYNLSDERMLFQLLDRLSFQRFVGFRHSRHISDRTTLCTFSERLVAAGAAATMFGAIQGELAKRGYIARSGQIVDASLVSVPRQRLGKEEKELIQQQATPSNSSPAKRRQQDTQARWTKKHGKSYFGYELSVSADKQYKLLRRIKISTAAENATCHLEDVLNRLNTSRDLYGDKGYVDGEREARLKWHGWRLHIQRKARQGKPLSGCQQRRNIRIARTRARVEHVFAGLECLGGKGLRCIGLARATLLLSWKAAT